jgi:hypothetical protein
VAVADVCDGTVAGYQHDIDAHYGLLG